MTRTVACPYCGERVALEPDPSGGRQQRYIEDCAVCCQPIEVVVTVGWDGELELLVHRQDD